MNRVTIGDMEHDLKKSSYLTSKKISDIEIVPRKIVEMIIAQCEEDVKDVGRWQNAFDQGRTHEANKIKKYAESLLNQFEFGRNDNTEEPLPFD